MEVSFTRFNAKLLLIYDPVASRILNDDYSRVVKGFRYFLGEKNSDRWVDVPIGYLTDGASVPRVFWSLIPPWGAYGQAAVLHDWLCENPYFHTPGGKVTIDRATVDGVLYEALEVLQVHPAIRTTIKLGVDFNRFIKRGKTDPTNPKKIRMQNDPMALSFFLKELTNQ